MTTKHTIRVMVVDDHALFRDGMVSVIRNQADMQVVGEASDGLEAFVMAQQLKPNVILMDINMAGTDGLEATKMISQTLPETHIVMLTMRDDNEHIFKAIQNGAQGYLLKTIRSKELIEMIRAAARGEAALNPAMAARVMAEFRRTTRAASVPTETGGESDLDELTPREQEVLSLIAQNLSDKEIAAALSISLYTVKSHVRNILAKLQVNNRREAARLRGKS